MKSRLGRVDGIFHSDFEQGEIGPGLYRHACLMGLEPWPVAALGDQKSEVVGNATGHGWLMVKRLALRPVRFRLLRNKPLVRALV